MEDNGFSDLKKISLSKEKKIIAKFYGPKILNILLNINNSSKMRKEKKNY